jgi:hypothetical protein
VSSEQDGMILSANGRMMQLRLDLGESSVAATVLWELVGSEQRQTAIALLAALIARTVAPGEADDELASVPGASAVGGRGD